MKGQYEFECYQTQQSRSLDRIRREGEGRIIYRFRFKGPNGKTMFPSHPYDSHANRARGIAAIKKAVPKAIITYK